MRLIPFYITISLVIVLSACAGSSGTQSPHAAKIPRKELRKLDEAIANSAKYQAAHHTTIDSLVKTLHSVSVNEHERRADLNMQIAAKMIISSADSALEYANAALTAAYAANNDSLVTEGEISRLNALTRAGIFNMAEKQLEELSERDMSFSQKIEYWKAGRYLYSYMHFYAIDNYEISENFNAKGIAYDDSLLLHLPADHISSQFITCERLSNQGNLRKAKTELEAIIKHRGPDDRYYGKMVYRLAVVYKNLGNETQYAANLALSAESDVRTCVGEGLALIDLADWLYDQGEVEHAFKYINFAMQQATSANARMRAVNIASLVPLIDSSYRDQIDRSHKILWLWFSLVLVLLASSIILLIVTIRQRMITKRNSRKMHDISKAQERHLANFLALCSTYYHQLTNLSQLVRRKIASGQTDELVKLLKSGKFADDQAEDIFEIFDRSFLELYPDFIEKINSLLRIEEQFEERHDKRLPVELRIYALVILGIPESTRIAQILNYSINTVYAYRNKMRNKAVDRENFEENLQKFSNAEQQFKS